MSATGNTHRKGWEKTSRLAPVELCNAAAQEFRSCEDPSQLLNQADSECSKLLQHILKEHYSELAEQANSFKSGAKYCGSAIGKFEPSNLRGPSADSGRVNIFIAVTTLDKTTGMPTFLNKPEDDTTPVLEWTEEEVTLEPGHGLIWKSGEYVSRVGGGHGGALLIIRFE